MLSPTECIFVSNSVNHNDEGKKFTCPYCEHKYKQKQHLQSHIISIHEGETLLCPKCDKVFTEIGRLQKHLQMLHNKTQNGSKNMNLK